MTEQAIALYNVALLANVTNRVKQIKPNQMKKQINATGVNGTFTGWVEVKLNNHKTTDQKMRNYHSGNNKTYDVHLIGGIIDGRMIATTEIMSNEGSFEGLLNGVQLMEIRVTQNLNELARQELKPSIISELKAKGFV